MNTGFNLFSNFVVFGRLPPFAPRESRRDRRNHDAKVRLLRLAIEIDDLEEKLTKVCRIEDREQFVEALHRFGFNDRRIHEDLAQAVKKLNDTYSRLLSS